MREIKKMSICHEALSVRNKVIIKVACPMKEKEEEMSLCLYGILYILKPRSDFYTVFKGTVWSL